MSRVIKFRAWDEVKKQLGPVIGIEWVNGGLYVEIRHPDPVVGSYKVARTELSGKLMQFTGLLDKNGKEIYEGDIVKALQGQPSMKAVEWQNSGKINGFNVASGKWWEVIGNIYENPELL